MEDQDDMSLVQRLVHKGENIREELRLIFQGKVEKQIIIEKEVELYENRMEVVRRNQPFNM